MKPDYNNGIELNTVEEIQAFVDKHYGHSYRFYAYGSYNWRPNKDNRIDELGFYCMNTRRGYAYYPKEEGK